MKTALLALAGLLVSVPLAFAQYHPYPCPPAPTAPDACGPGYYNRGPYGMAYGPNHNVYPPFPPFNGLLPTPPWAVPPPPTVVPEFASHPYARSPRDFYMYPQDRDQ